MIKIAIASGKGGTGKTTVAVNLALTASAQGTSTVYLDCDVEEPNGALFLNPTMTRENMVEVSVPEWHADKCAGCGVCGRICQYNAIAALDQKVMIFPELCHGCAGCWLACPKGAITESFRVVGKQQEGQVDNIVFLQGLLNVGEAMSPPVIRAVKQNAPQGEFTIVDAPPGTSCPAIESIRDMDFVVLVTEPTPFGLNDLKLAVKMVRALQLPCGVVINRANDPDDTATLSYCREAGVDIIGKIPDDRKVAEAYSRGETAFVAVDGYREIFKTLFNKITTTAAERSI